MSRTIQVTIVGDASSLERAFNKSALASKKLSLSFGSLVKGAAGIAGVTVGVRALGEAFKSVVNTSADFQTAMQHVVSLAGGAQSSIKGLSDQVLALGPKVGKSPQELAESLYFVASAGIAASKQMGVVTQAAKDSAAGMGDTQTVADALTSAMNAYGQANLSAAKASDVLVATVREGKGEAADFAPILGHVVPIAAQLGVSFDQVGAALAAMTQLGTPAETAAIQLGQIFSTLLKTSPKSQKAFDSVGLSVDKLRSQLAGPDGLRVVLNEVRDAFGGNDKALALAFGNIRALRGVLALVGKNANEVSGVFDRLANSTGSSAHAFAAVSNTEQQRFNQLSAAIKVAEIRIGAGLAPVIEKVTRDLLKLTDRLDKWLSSTKNQEKIQRIANETFKTAKDVIGGIKDVVVPLATELHKLTDAVGGTRRAVKLLLAAFLAYKTAKVLGILDLIRVSIIGIGTQAEISAGKVGGLRVALLRLAANPAIAIPAAIAAIGAGVVIASRTKPLASQSGGVQAATLNRLPGPVAQNLISQMSKAQRDALIPLLKKFDNTALVRFIQKLDKFTGSGSAGNDNLKGGRAGRSATQTTGSAPPPRHVPPPTPRIGPPIVTPDPKKAATALRKALDKLFAGFSLQLADARKTKTLKDDQTVLEKQLNTVKDLLAKHKGNLQLEHEEAKIQGELTALHNKQAAALKKQKDALASAVQDQQTIFGQFFESPINNPSVFLGGARGKQIIAGQGASAGNIANTFEAQIKSFTVVQDAIATLVKRGAPAGLITSARKGEIDPQVLISLANASQKQLTRIFGDFRRANKLITQAAKAEVNARTVTLNAATVNLAGMGDRGSGKNEPEKPLVVVLKLNGKQIAQSIVRDSKKRANQRRGRVGGTR